MRRKEKKGTKGNREVRRELKRGEEMNEKRRGDSEIIKDGKG